MGPVFCRVPVIMASGRRPGEHGPSWAVRYRHRAAARPAFTYGNRQKTKFYSSHLRNNCAHVIGGIVSFIYSSRTQHCGLQIKMYLYKKENNYFSTFLFNNDIHLNLKVTNSDNTVYCSLSSDHHQVQSELQNLFQK